MKLPDMSEYGDSIHKYGKLAIIVIGLVLFFKSKAVQRILLVLVLVAVGAIIYVWGPVPRTNTKFLTDVGLKLRVKAGKLTITNVDLTSPAVQDRPLVNDVILEVNGDPVSSVEDFLIAAKKPRSTLSVISMEVRGDNGTKVRRTVKIRPPGQKSDSRVVGARGIHLDWLEPNPGVVITEVTAGTPADGKLDIDDLLLSESGSAILILDDLEQPLVSTNTVLVEVVKARGGQVGVTLTMGSGPPGSNIVITVNNRTSRNAYFCDVTGTLTVLFPDDGSPKGIPAGSSKAFTVTQGNRYEVHPPSITKGSTPHGFVPINLGVLTADATIDYIGS